MSPPDARDSKPSDHRRGRRSRLAEDPRIRLGTPDSEGTGGDEPAPVAGAGGDGLALDRLPEAARRPARREPRRPRIGLALGSGVARGWAHIGVLKALARHGIDVDIVAGTSIGAVVGAAFVTDRLDRLELWTRRLTKARVLSYADISLAGGALLRGGRLRRLMQRQFGGFDFSETDRPFLTVATDLITGHEAWIQRGPLLAGIEASFALPGVFPPVWVDRWLVDGALVNPVPVNACRALGARMVIAVNLNGDILGRARHAGETIPAAAGFDIMPALEAARHERLAEDPDALEDTLAAEPGPVRRGLRRLALPAFARPLFGRRQGHPSAFGVLVSTLNIVQDRITRSRLAGEPPDIHIAPHIGHVGLMEFHRADELIEAGEAAVEASLADIRTGMEVFDIAGQPTHRPDLHE